MPPAGPFAVEGSPGKETPAVLLSRRALGAEAEAELRRMVDGDSVVATRFRGLVPASEAQANVVSEPRTDLRIRFDLDHPRPRA